MTAPPQMPEMAPISPDWRHLAKSFCRLGATEEQLAALFSVSPQTIAGWMAEIPEFADAVRRGRTFADADVAHNLHRLAVGYSHTVERVFKGGRDGPVTVSYLKHYPPHPKACMDWLVNRCPEYWGRAAIKRKLQEWEDARDAAARRPPLLSTQALAALVLAHEEERRALDPGPAVDPVGAGDRQLVDEPYGTGMGVCRTVVARVAAQGVLGWFGAGPRHDEDLPAQQRLDLAGAADETHAPVLVAPHDVAGVVPARAPAKALIPQPNLAHRLSSSGGEFHCHQSVTRLS